MFVYGSISDSCTLNNIKIHKSEITGTTGSLALGKTD